MHSPDVVIIGTGVIGAALAFELSKAGYATLSLDRNRQVGHGSTAASCAIVRMHYSTMDGTAFAWEGYHYWRDWRDYLGLPNGTELAQFRQCGCLVLKTPANGHMARHLANSRALDIPVEEWDRDRILQRLPVYSLDSFAPPKRTEDPAFGLPGPDPLTGAVFWPRAGYVTDPAQSAQNLMQAAQLHGAGVQLGATVAAILKDKGRVQGVQLADGTRIHAPIVVNVAGPASAQINRMAGVIEEMTITTQPLRQEVVHVPAPDGFAYEAEAPIVSDSDIGCYSRPEQGNHILIGSEDPDCDPHVWAPDDQDYARDFTGQWTTQAMRMGQRMPTLAIPSRMRGVVDLYDASTDWIPIYDATSLGGYYMACGTSGNQFKNAAIAAKLMTALIDYCEAGHDHDQTPLQFELPYIKRRINAGFFARNRAINTESSFSVLG